MKVYILQDEYASDGPKIYGVYSTIEKAKNAKKEYESDDNEYGKSCDSLDILPQDVD